MSLHATGHSPNTPFRPKVGISSLTKIVTFMPSNLTPVRDSSTFWMPLDHRVEKRPVYTVRLVSDFSIAHNPCVWASNTALRRHSKLQSWVRSYQKRPEFGGHAARFVETARHRECCSDIRGIRWPRFGTWHCRLWLNGIDFARRMSRIRDVTAQILDSLRHCNVRSVECRNFSWCKSIIRVIDIIFYFLKLFYLKNIECQSYREFRKLYRRHNIS